MNEDEKDLISIFDPLVVGIHPDGSLMTNEEYSNMWLRLNGIPEEVYLLLSSSLLAEKMVKMRRELQLSDDTTLRIASSIRKVFFKEIPFDQLRLFLQNVAGVETEKIDRVIAFIQQEMLTLKVEQKIERREEKKVEKTIPLAILDTLSQFPGINDQQITVERIKIRSEKEPVRGTVRNWLRAYRDVLGVRKHSSVERGQFIFHSENAKKLSAEEREKVALILRSLDELVPLDINPDKRQIIFPEYAPATNVSSEVPVASSVQVAPSTPLAIPKSSMVAPVVAQNQMNQNTAPSMAQTPFQQKSTPQFISPTGAPKVEEAMPKHLDDLSDDVLFQRVAAIKPVHNFSSSKKSVGSINAALSGVINKKPPINFAQPKTQQIPSQSQSSVQPQPQSQIQAQSQPSSQPKPLNNQSFQFSSGQILPGEKVLPAKENNANIKPFSPGAPLPKPPVSSGNIPAQKQKKEVWQVPNTIRNIVDLRSEE